MERKILDAGKKTAEDLAPEPIKHTPEAPIISEEEAQIIESPDTDGETRVGENLGKKLANDDTPPEDSRVRLQPKDDHQE